MNIIYKMEIYISPLTHLDLYESLSCIFLMGIIVHYSGMAMECIHFNTQALASRYGY